MEMRRNSKPRVMPMRQQDPATSSSASFPGSQPDVSQQSPQQQSRRSQQIPVMVSSVGDAPFASGSTASSPGSTLRAPRPSLGGGPSSQRVSQQQQSMQGPRDSSPPRSAEMQDPRQRGRAPTPPDDSNNRGGPGPPVEQRGLPMGRQTSDESGTSDVQERSPPPQQNRAIEAGGGEGARSPRYRGSVGNIPSGGAAPASSANATAMWRQQTLNQGRNERQNLQEHVEQMRRQSEVGMPRRPYVRLPV